jgi:hypothetical protein
MLVAIFLIAKYHNNDQQLIVSKLTAPQLADAKAVVSR